MHENSFFSDNDHDTGRDYRNNIWTRLATHSDATAIDVDIDVDVYI